MLKATCNTHELRKLLAQSMPRTEKDVPSISLEAKVLENGLGVIGLSYFRPDFTATAWAQAMVREPGSVTVSAQVLDKTLEALGTYDVELEERKEQDETYLRVSLEAQTADVLCFHSMPGEDFPTLEESAMRSMGVLYENHGETETPVLSEPVHIDGKTLTDIINLVVPTTADEDSRPVLTTVRVEARGSEARFVGADGFRMGVLEATLSEELSGDLRFSLPATAVSAAAGQIDMKDVVKLMVAPDTGHTVISHRQGVVVGRPVDGNFPNYEQLLPQDNIMTTVARLDSAEFRRAVELAKVYSYPVGRKGIRIRVRATGEETCVIVEGENEGNGYGHSRISARATGPDAQLFFDTEFVDTLLPHLKGMIAISITEENKPMVFRTSEDLDYTLVLMPLMAWHLNRDGEGRQ